MGNSSSLLTQQDLEDLQNKCNNLCETDTRPLSPFPFFCLAQVFLFYILIIRKTKSDSFLLVASSDSQREIIGLYELDRTGKGYISADEFMRDSPQICSESLCQVWIWYDLLVIFPILFQLFNLQDLLISEACHVMFCCRGYWRCWKI